MTKTLRGISLIGALTMASAGAWLACGDDTSNANNPTDAGHDATSSGSGSSGASGSSGSSSGKSSSSSSGGSSSSSSSSSGGSSSGGSDAGDGGGPVTCAVYCATITANCTGANQQYASADECTTACKYFDTADADTGNTLLCHNEHANNAKSAPNPHCWHAGPYGWGVCGNQCDDFCKLATSYCVADAGFDGSPPYASLSDCTTACMTFANVGDSGIAIVTGGDAATSYNSMGPGSGNTLDCREWHLGNALTMPGGAAQALHCQHPGADSGVCQ